MMPIREGNTEKMFFYSDKTYLTVYVDGELIRNPNVRFFGTDDILVTSEADKNPICLGIPILNGHLLP